MRVIKVLGLLLFAGNVFAWGPECGQDYPVFESKPPEITVEQEGNGSVSLLVKYEHDSLKLYALNLSILVPKADGFEQIDVPLAFFREGEYAVTGVTTLDSNKENRYHLRAKYSEHHCGPSVSLDFTIE
jgi:hypothetical protein